MSDNKYPLALPPGTILSGQYVIERVLGQGGFGITYKAIDHKNNNKPVAVKEYFPDSMVYRSATTVISHPGERTEFFEYGKQSFLAEAETLAKFIGNPNIVRVYSYFEENGTAYFAMEYVDGIPFDKYLRDRGGRIGIDEAKTILIPVMNALGAVHRAGIVHRDVTPDNIYISNDGRIMLLDFGAARYSLGDKSRSLDVVLKHGFAPKEQYSRRGKQGPFTDVYALGATFYFALTGRRPPDSIERMEDDDLVPPSTLGVKITAYQEEAILKALNVSPHDRYQSMAEFKAVMLNEPVAEQFVYPQAQAVPNSSMPYPQTTAAQGIPATMPAQSIPNPGGYPPAVAAQGIPATMPVQSIPNPGSYQQNMPVQGIQNTVPVQSIPNTGTGVQPPVNSYPQQINPAISVPPSNFNIQKRSSKKPLYIGIGAACAVIGIVVALVIGAGASKKENPHVDTVSIGAASSDTNSKSGQTVSQLMGSAMDKEPTDTSSAYTSKYSKEDLEIIGNSAANIKNDGCYVEQGTTRIWVDEDGHSLLSNVIEDLYLYKDQEGLFSCLSLVNNTLYCVYNGKAYSYEVLKDDSFNVIESLKSYTNIERLYVTNAFFFIFQDDKVYRINRNTGKSEQTIDVGYDDDFTFYDGWMYIVGEDASGNSALYRVREDDFSVFGDSYLYKTEGYYSSPLVYDDDVYLLYINGSTTKVLKTKSDFDNTDEVYYDISDIVNSGSKAAFICDLNVIGNNIFVTIGRGSGDDTKLYVNRIIVTGTACTADESMKNYLGYSPSVFLDSKGNYELDLMGYDSEKKSYTSYFFKYDPRTGKDITNDNLKD